MTADSYSRPERFTERVAAKRFPAAADRLQRKKDHGRAEAALLALYHDNTDHAGRGAA